MTKLPFSPKLYGNAVRPTLTYVSKTDAHCPMAGRGRNSAKK